MSVITAITAQNTLGVQAIGHLDSELVSAQLKSVVSDIGVDAIKTGMLSSAETILSIVTTLASLYTLGAHPALVVDPVLVSTSGHSLLPSSAVDVLRSCLFPWATVITPNIPEAEVLADAPGSIKNLEDMRSCARKLGGMGARWVYLKGGHMPVEMGGKKVVLDLLWDSKDEVEVLAERPYLESRNTHGTGCTLSAAIAAELAKGKTGASKGAAKGVVGAEDAAAVPEAVLSAGDYVSAAIASSYPLGSGSGPVNHFHALIPRSLPLPTPLSPQPFTDFLINYSPEVWRRYVHHPFPNALGAGTASLSAFLHFIEQDYHFLKVRCRFVYVAPADSLPF